MLAMRGNRGLSAANAYAKIEISISTEKMVQTWSGTGLPSSLRDLVLAAHVQEAFRQTHASGTRFHDRSPQCSVIPFTNHIRYHGISLRTKRVPQRTQLNCRAKECLPIRDSKNV
jgi:hypothetical protein